MDKIFLSNKLQKSLVKFSVVVKKYKKVGKKIENSRVGV
jgi:hypothetical protein